MHVESWRLVNRESVVPPRDGPASARAILRFVSDWDVVTRTQGTPRAQGTATKTDYAGPWTAQRGRCFRFICVREGDYPTGCQEPPVQVGWKFEASTGRWYALDACERHAAELFSHPSR